jgi:hypothetical protein
MQKDIVSDGCGVVTIVAELGYQPFQYLEWSRKETTQA